MDEFVEAGVDAAKARRQRFAGREPDGAAGEAVKTSTGREFDDAEPGVLSTAVDAEDAHVGSVPCLAVWK